MKIVTYHHVNPRRQRALAVCNVVVPPLLWAAHAAAVLWLARKFLQIPY